MSSLYNLRSTELGSYKITKFDSDLNVQAAYDVSEAGCTCPGGSRSMCRHRLMLPVFIARGHIDDGYLYDFDRKTWHQPITNEV